VGATYTGQDALRIELEQIRKDVEAEVIPTEKSSTEPRNEPSTSEHKTKVMRTINYFLMSTRKEGQTKLQNLFAAGKALTQLRNEGAQYSQSLVLRDAQRYFYGVLGPYVFSNRDLVNNTIDLRKFSDLVGEDLTAKKEEKTAMGTIIAMGADPAYNFYKEFMIEIGREKSVRSNPDNPVSGVGGAYWYDLGAMFHYERDTDFKVKGAAKLVSPEDVQKYDVDKAKFESDKLRMMSTIMTTTY
jgi:hypothetical protein